MAKTWSNRKATEQPIPIGRAGARRSPISLFLIAVVVAVVVFCSLLTYTVGRILLHPPAEYNGAAH